MYQKRINEYGITVGRLPRGSRNKITDVAGVLVGHKTIDNENRRHSHCAGARQRLRPKAAGGGFCLEWIWKNSRFDAD